MSIKDRYEKFINQQVEKQHINTPKTICKRELDITDLISDMNKMTNERYLNLHKLIVEADISTLHKHIFNRTFSITELVTFYIKRIYKYDKKINSVIELNPDAINIAKKLDIKVNEGSYQGKLFGIPVLLKDNIGTGDKMHNTAGSKVLENSQCDADAFIVKKLRESGAVILGKANLTEWANIMTRDSANGYSALGGQAKNAYGQFDVGGSSAGSAVAVSLNLTAVSIGTETEGSIIYPASQNGVVGIKLSTGLWSKDRIIPIAYSMDTAGSITRTVSDTAIMLGELVGEDINDSDTYVGNKYGKKDYTQFLDKDGLKGVKIGLVINEQYCHTRYGDKEILDRVVRDLTKLGAEVKEVTITENGEKVDYYNVLMHEFKIGLAKYLNRNVRNKIVANLSEIIEFNNEDLENRAIYGQDQIEYANNLNMSERDNKELVERMRKRSRELVDNCLISNNVDMLLSLSVNLSGFYATAGYPAITVPAGYRKSGEPVGMTLVSKMFAEDKLIKAAYAYEQGTKFRNKPCIDNLI